MKLRPAYVTSTLLALTWTAAVRAEAPAGDDSLDARVRAQAAAIDAQERRIRELEDAVRASAPPPPPPPPASAPAAAAARPVDTAPWVALPAAGPRQTARPARDVVVSGYLQAQYESHEESEDQLRQSGQLANQDRFLLRRARIRVEREWDYSSFVVELDGNTTNGPAVAVQKAEASLFWRGGREAPEGPLAKGTVGLFDTPFGLEMVESPRKRWFSERTLASRAFFPGEPDLGVRASGEAAWFRWVLAAVNGNPVGDKTGFSLQNANAHQDLVLRVGAAARASERVALAGGVSMLSGKGFHKGTVATKSTVRWNDTNEDGQIQPTELAPQFGLAPVPSESFDRWLVGADLRLLVTTPLGATTLQGELYAASNLDRGSYLADPVSAGTDLRELGWYVAATQEIGRYGVVGIRTEYYDPNADFLDRQGGKLQPSSQSVRTWSPMLGLVLPERARLLFQYDFVRDRLARDLRGVPTDLKNDQWTLRLQVEL